MKTIVSMILLTASFAFAQTEVWDFDTLDGWSGDTEHSSIVAAPAGMTGNALLMQASDADQMTWMTWETTLGAFASPQVSFQFRVADTEPANPTELFIRFGGWNDYVGIKEADEGNDSFVIEVRASGEPAASLPAPISFDSTHSVVLTYLPGDQIGVVLDGSPVGIATAQPWDPDLSFGDLSIRSQKAVSHLDNLTIENVPEPAAFMWLAGLMALLLVCRRQRAG